MSEILIFIKNNVFIHLKYLILETPYTFLFISSWSLVLHTLMALSPLFSGINKNNLFMLCLKDIEKTYKEGI